MEEMTTDQEETVPVDPAAPYGRKVDGSPKRAPGGRPPKASSGPAGTRRPTGKAGRPRTRLGSLLGGDKPAAPPPPKTKPKTAAPADRDYTEGLTAWIQILALPLRKVDPLDSAVVLLAAPTIAENVNELAHTDAKVAAFCDKFLATGPWTGLGFAVGSVVAQIAENHGKCPPILRTMFGAMPRQVFGAYVTGQADEMAAQPQPQETGYDASRYDEGTQSAETTDPGAGAEPQVDVLAGVM